MIYTEEEKRVLYARIECMLFVAGDPVELSELSRVLDIPAGELLLLLTGMEADYREGGRGIIPVLTDSTLQMTSNPRYVNDIEQLLRPEQKKSVSKSLMETLSVIAYKEPVTRADIEAVRGVRCEYAVSQLLKMGLIEQCGRKNALGRPVLFRTTDAFLRQFGLHSRSELPGFSRLSEFELAGDQTENSLPVTE